MNSVAYALKPRPPSAHSCAASAAAFGMSPLGGDLVAFLYAYFDESMGDSGAFTVAGYTFKQSRLAPFERAWQRMLNRYGLPYFRMSLCAHRNGVFADLSKDECIAVETRAIELIGEYACDGYAVSFPERMMDAPSLQQQYHGMQDYEWTCWAAMTFVRRWADEHAWPGKIQYKFEAGHANQSRANAFLNVIASDADLRAAYRYRGHMFVPKHDSGAVQAADLLAWQVNKNLKRQKAGQGSRADFKALLDAKHANLVLADPTGHPLHHWLTGREGERLSIKQALLQMPPARLVRSPARRPR